MRRYNNKPTDTIARPPSAAPTIRAPDITATTTDGSTSTTARLQADADALDHILSRLGALLYERRAREGQLRQLQDQRDRLTWDLLAVAPNTGPSPPPSLWSSRRRPDDPGGSGGGGDGAGGSGGDPRRQGLERVRVAISDAEAGLDGVDEDFGPLTDVFWRSLYARARLERGRRRNGVDIYRDVTGGGSVPRGGGGGGSGAGRSSEDMVRRGDGDGRWI